MLIINDEDNNYYYFAVKNLSELISSGWLRSKKEAIINDDKDFQNALNDALNYQNIETQQERISILKSYINRCNWEGIEFPASSKSWIKFDRNNKTIALNILFIPHNTKTIRIAYRSEYNNKCKKQVILLMITGGKKWHYLVITNLFALLRGKSSNHHEDFYCLNCFNSYTTKSKLKEYEERCNNHDSCHVEMPKWVEKILKYNLGEKSLKAPFAIYLDLACLLKKKNNFVKIIISKNLTQRKKLGMSLLVGQRLHEKEKKLDYCGRNYCIENLCKKLKKRAMKLINLK